MNYYKRHLGDYARKAGHLSPLEHGVYNLILDAYYDREQAPTRVEAIRYARARAADEVAAVDAVLSEFFTLTDGVYVQSRVEQEFVEAALQAEKNRRNGKAGGRPRKAKKNPVESQPKPTGLPEESQTKGNPLIHQSINPEQESKALVQPTAAQSRFAEFWLAYPNKKSKQEAEKSWRKLKLDSRCDELIDHVRKMAATDADWLRGYIPMGSTYLNQARWDDVPRRPPTNGTAAPSKTLGAMQTLQGIRHGLAGDRTSERANETALLGFGSDPGE